MGFDRLFRPRVSCGPCDGVDHRDGTGLYVCESSFPDPIYCFCAFKGTSGATSRGNETSDRFVSFGSDRFARAYAISCICDRLCRDKTKTDRSSGAGSGAFSFGDRCVLNVCIYRKLKGPPVAERPFLFAECGWQFLAVLADDQVVGHLEGARHPVREQVHQVRRALVRDVTLERHAAVLDDDPHRRPEA